MASLELACARTGDRPGLTARVPARPLMVSVMLLAACGRIGFDRHDGGAGDGEPGDGALASCTFLDVSAGRDHTCALDGNGSVFCWGRNDQGQAAPGGPSYVLVPTKVVLGEPAVHVAVGRDVSCAHLASNSVSCWGENDRGQLGIGTATRVTGVRQVMLGDSVAAIGTAIGTGTYHACAIRASDRSVACWGENQYFAVGTPTRDEVVTLPTVVPNTQGATSLAVGHRHVCVALETGESRCWGRNEYGQLATTPTVERASADVAAGVTGTIQLDSGGRHTCAVDGAGALRCWGKNAERQLGLGAETVGAHSAPATVLAGNVASVSTGTAATCAVLTSGELDCWGNATPGDGTFAMYSTPTPTGITGATAVSIGFFTTCAIVEGSIQCWGRNETGQLGRGYRSLETAPVTALVTGTTRLAVGGSHACASNGTTVECWGANDLGQLGLGSRDGTRTPTVVSTALSTIDGITAGQFHTCAWGAGVVKCWGSNTDGAAGPNAASPFQTSPITVPGFGPLSAISAGARHTCSLSNGAAQCWGDNAFGQLGNGTTTDSNTLVTAMNVTSPTAICAGGNHACAIDGNTVKCWGANGVGQLGDTTTVNRPVAVTSLTATAISGLACGRDHTCAIETGGVVRCWGRNLSGELGQGDYTTSRTSPVAVTLLAPATAIFAGGYSTCAKLSTGAVYCWGDNHVGQLANGSTGASADPEEITALANVDTIELGASSGCALRAGTTSCWGTTHVTGNGDNRDAVPMSPAFTCTP